MVHLQIAQGLKCMAFKPLFKLQEAIVAADRDCPGTTIVWGLVEQLLLVGGVPITEPWSGSSSCMSTPHRWSASIHRVPNLHNFH
jgi:hypothetical protein